MSKSRYERSLFLRTLKSFKGRFCYLLDLIDLLHRFIGQKFASLRQVDKSTTKTLHLLCVSRDDYLVPTINCANSFWQYHPEFQIKIWCDEERIKLLSKKIGKFHRRDRIELMMIEVKPMWQETKLELICEKLGVDGIYSDVDMFWNGRIKSNKNPIFFLKEYEFSEYAQTKRLKNLLGLDQDISWFMLNVSLVFLGELAQLKEFRSRAYELFQKISSISHDEVLGKREISSIHRMSEQLALSIAAQEFGKFEYLKEQDFIMDGGIAESFYLGATNGF